MQVEDYLKLLDSIAVDVENELERSIRDSHDYSSSDYSGYDDGHNGGVFAGIELFVEKLKESVVNTSDDDGLDRLSLLRYRLLGAELVEVRTGVLGGVLFVFDNGDRLECLHVTHRESEDA